MRKLLLVGISLLVLGLPNAHARNSAATYDGKYYSQQEFVQVLNASTAPIYRDYVVGLDTTGTDTAANAPGINPNVNLGQYVTEQTSSTTDSIYVFGVADETIPAGQLGRVCIRGPHKVVVNSNAVQPSTFSTSVGTVLSQCKNNVPSYGPDGVPSHVQNGGYACAYSTATGTAAGALGYIISSTATTDTGDVGQSTNAQSNTTGSEYWAWIEPKVLR